jgi:chromosome segregation ATPase
MKNFQQHLLVVLALGLCVLCVYQWYEQTLQRRGIESLSRVVYDKSVLIRDYTNSIATMNHQIAEMDAHLTELKETAKTNEQVILSQRRELNRLEATSEALTNGITQYKQAVDSLTAKLKDAYDGVKKQDDAIKELVAQRDEFVKKYNDEVKDRNDIVAKYNELVKQVEKLQGSGK